MTAIDYCPICVQVKAPRVRALGKRTVGGHEYHVFRCPVCGFYGLDDGAVIELIHSPTLSTTTRMAIAHWVRKRSPGVLGADTPTNCPLISFDTLLRVREEERLADASEAVDNLLLWLAASSSGLGEHTTIENAADFVAIVGSATQAGVWFSVTSGFRAGLLDGSPPKTMMPSLEGWKRIKQLRHAGIGSRKAFLAVKFDSPSFSQSIESAFKSAVAETGFRLLRVNEEPRAGVIDVRLMLDIREARFVVVELSDANPGAYWEGGFAEGLEKPVIYLCERSVWEDKDRKPHFDANHRYFVVWDRANPMPALKEFKAAIRYSVPEAIQADPESSP